MGAFCSCFRDEHQVVSNPNSSFLRNCMCLRCLTQNLLHLYTSLFWRGEVHALSPSTHGSGSLSSRSSLDDSIADMYHSPPRPLPYDADPRYFRLQRDGLVSRREKGSSHLHEATEPLRRIEDEDAESVGSKWHESACEQGLKECDSKISLKFSTANKISLHIYFLICTLPLKRKMSVPPVLKSILKKIQRSSPNALIISILVVYMSGWREVKTVPFVARFDFDEPLWLWVFQPNLPNLSHASPIVPAYMPQQTK